MAKRGLAAADEATRKRVASMGGRASHGGGRPSRSYFSEITRNNRKRR